MLDWRIDTFYDESDDDDEMLELTKAVLTNGSNLDLTFDSL